MTGKAALVDRCVAELVAGGLDAEAFRSSATTLTADDLRARATARIGANHDGFFYSEHDVGRAVDDAFEIWIGRLSSVCRNRVLSGRPVRVVTLLAGASEGFLQAQGRELVLVVSRGEPGREILRWRQISLILPPSLLAAAARISAPRTTATVRLLHPSMAPDTQVAHQHLHHAATLNFEELWASARLRALTSPAEFRQSLMQERAWCPHLHEDGHPEPCLRSRKNARQQVQTRPEASARHMAEWADLLFNAFIVRSLLDRHAGHRDPLDRCGSCRKGFRTVRPLLSGRGRDYSATGTLYPWGEERYRLARHYRVPGTSTASGRWQRDRSAFIRAQVLEELNILSRAFGRVRPDAEITLDETYECLLLQYLRVKKALFRVLVHPPGERGLENFLEHFLQIKVYEPLADQLLPGPPREPGLKVASTEYRVAPDAWINYLGGRRITDEAFRHEGPEAAWLIHFKRTEQKGDLPLYGKAIRDMREEARKIGNALEREPARLRTLRGIDICGVEQNQPLWVSAEILRKLRHRSSQIAAKRPALKLRPLHLTLHAGEDFEWLTSGMRAIAEPFFWRLIQRGDRIGHGIAVTLDPVGWWRLRAGRTTIRVKRIDRLLDLAFLAAYTDQLPQTGRNQQPHKFSQGRGWIQDLWLGAQVEQVVRAIGLRIPPQISRAELIRQAKLFWREIGGPIGCRVRQSDVRPTEDKALHIQWLYSYFWSRSVQRLAEHKSNRIPLQVRSPRSIECTLLTKARLRLVRELARWQIPIESNPSSNLVVAGLDAMASQDFLAQTPHKKRGPGEETLPWTISTDDPITFATSLADEYAYAWAGMVLREKDPFDPAHARALLEEAAATSMRTRFTLPDVA